MTLFEATGNSSVMLHTLIESSFVFLMCLFSAYKRTLKSKNSNTSSWLNLYVVIAITV